MNLLKGTIDQVDSQTLPQVAQLINGAINNAAQLIDGMLTNAEACAADAITDLDSIADRKLAVLATLLEPLNRIVSGGLKLSGTIGGIPVDLVLEIPAAPQPTPSGEKAGT